MPQMHDARILSSVRVLMFASICTGFWQYVAPDATVVQQLSIALLVLAAGLATLQKQVTLHSLTVTEIVLYSASIVSAIMSMYRGADPSILFSMAFLATLVSLSILVRTVPTEQILDIGAFSILFLQICSFAFCSHDFIRALSITVTNKGLFRFAPFNSHPNLIGFIFGGGTVLLARRAIVTRRLSERIVFIAATAAGWAIVFAASARASVIALSVASVITVLREIPLRRVIAVAACVAAGVAAMFSASKAGDAAVNYVTGILEFSSHTRGVGSGGSGRTDLWNKGISTLLSDPLLFAFGGGLRSSDIANIGFSTEDSYITIMLDCGLFASACIIGCYFYCFFKSLSLTRTWDHDGRRLALLPTFFVFILFESIFNRYLLGIGNPMSLFVLTLLISVANRVKTQTESARTALAAPPTMSR